MVFKGFFDKSPTPCWVIDMELLTIQDLNESCINYYGYNREELLGQPFSILFPEGEQEYVMQQIGKEKEYGDMGIWRHIRKNGAVFYVQLYASYAKIHGRDTCLLGAIDVDEKVKLSRLSRQLHFRVNKQKSRLEELLTAVNVVIWSCRADDYTTTYVNGSSYKVFGYYAEELIGRNGIIISQVYPEDMHILHEAIGELFRTGNVCFELRIHHRDGSTRYLRHDCTLLYDDRESAAKIHNVSVDVTERRKAEEREKEQERKAIEMFDGLEDAFVAVDENQKLTFMNRAFRRLFHLNEKQGPGSSIWDFFRNGAREKLQQYFTIAFQQQTTKEFEFYVASEGKWLSIKLYPIAGGLGVYFRDITTEKLYLNKVNEQKKRLEDIAWMQSHQVRGPVATIKGLLQLINLKSIDDKELLLYLESLSATSKDLDKIIHDINEQITKTVYGEAHISVKQSKANTKRA